MSAAIAATAKDRQRRQRSIKLKPKSCVSASTSLRRGRRRTAVALLALLAAQLIAGLAMARGSLPLGLALLHNLLAACLLATLVLLV